MAIADEFVAQVPAGASDDDARRLLRFVRHADSEALSSLWLSHTGDARRLARWICGDRAEDAMQEAAIHVLRSAGGWRDRGPGSARAWLLTVVANAARRQRRRDGHFLQPLHEVGARLAPDEQPTESEHWEQVQAALQQLARRYRRAIELRYLVGLDFAAVAVALGVPEATARTHVFRGLEHLRARLASGPTTPPGTLPAWLIPAALPLPSDGLVATASTPTGMFAGGSVVAWGGAGILAATLAAMALIAPAQPPLLPDSPPPSAAVAGAEPAAVAAPLLEQALAQRLSVDFRRDSIWTVVRDMQERIAWPLRPRVVATIGLQGKPDTGITFAAKNQTLRQCLDGLCQAYGWRWRSTSRGIIIDQPDALGSSAAVERFRTATTTDGARAAAVAVALCTDADAVRGWVRSALDGTALQLTALSWMIDEAHEDSVLIRGFSDLDCALIPFEILADDAAIKQQVVDSWNRKDLTDAQRISLCVLAERIGCTALVDDFLRLATPALERLHELSDPIAWRMAGGDQIWWEDGLVFNQGRKASLEQVACAALVTLAPKQLAAAAEQLPNPTCSILYCRLDDARALPETPMAWQLWNRHPQIQQRMLQQWVGGLANHPPAWNRYVLAELARNTPDVKRTALADLFQHYQGNLRAALTQLTLVEPHGAVPEPDPGITAILAELLVRTQDQSQSALPTLLPELVVVHGLDRIIRSGAAAPTTEMAYSLLGSLRTAEAERTVYALARETEPSLPLVRALAALKTTEADTLLGVCAKGLKISGEEADYWRNGDFSAAVHRMRFFNEVSDREVGMYPAFLLYYGAGQFDAVQADGRPPEVVYPLLRSQLQGRGSSGPFGLQMILRFRRPGSEFEAEISAEVERILLDPQQTPQQRVHLAYAWLHRPEFRRFHRQRLDELIARIEHAVVKRELSKIRAAPAHRYLNFDGIDLAEHPADTKPSEAPATPNF